MACGCQKTREERIAEMEARRAAAQAVQEKKKAMASGPSAPGYYHQPPAPGEE